MNGNTNLAIAQGLKQNGVNMKAQLMATGYGQDLLDQPIANQLGPSVIFTQGWAPVEAKTKATKQFQADLKKYADFTGVPDFGDLHRLHRLRPGHHRAEGAGQEPRPEHLRRRPARARQGQPGRPRLRAHRPQRRELRQARADDLQWALYCQGRQVRHPEAEGRQRPVVDREAGRRIGHGERHHHHGRARLVNGAPPDGPLEAVVGASAPRAAKAG